MTKNVRVLTTKQRRAISALMTSKSKEAAAAKAGVSPRSLSRWLTDPDFQVAVRLAQDEALERAFSHLVEQATAAVAVLADVAADTEATPAARVSAARALLENALRFAELNALAARVAALEEALTDGS